jgi:hypothetical protein
MHVVFSHAEAISIIREYWKFLPSAEIAISDEPPSVKSESEWTPVRWDWCLNKPPTQTKSTIDVRFNDAATDRGIATDWSASWNQNSTHRIVEYRVCA